MQSPQSFMQPGAEVADYQIERMIARGGMGEVYLAKDRRLERLVALKVLPPDLSGNEKFRSRFMRESRLAASVDHPNILPIYGAGESDGQLYIAMRYVRGSDLRGELAKRGRPPWSRALEVLHDTAAALDAAHAAGLIHRDVKPANILLADDVAGETRRHVYLADFGLTRRTRSGSGLTTAGHFMGTIDYVAPEQIRGGVVDGRADVYALACVAYEMIAGHPPFQRDDDTALLWAHIFEEPPRLSELVPTVPATTDLAISSGLAKSPEDRPATCGDLVKLMGSGQLPAADAVGQTQAAGGSGRPALQVREEARKKGPDHDDGQRPAADSRERPTRARWTRWGLGGVVAAAALVTVLATVMDGREGSSGDGQAVPFSARGIPYTLDVPKAWTPRRSEAGDSTTTVLSPTDLRDLFSDVQPAVERTAGLVQSNPEDVTGLTIYHRPFLQGQSPADRVFTAEALLPGETSLVDRGRTTAGEVDAQAMTGTIGLPHQQSLQVRLLAVETQPVQLLVFFAPPARFGEEQGTFDKVAASLDTTG